MNLQDTSELRENLDIAIIGMAGRFPGARNLDEFWRNLRDGVESITSYSEEQLRAFGVDPAALADPSFIKVGALLDGIDLFDAAFFGYSPREAEIIDPQHRIFLECAWEALDSAGYNSENYQGLIGVYAATSMSSYLLFNLLANLQDPQDSFQAMIGNDKDFLSTRVSYELNLKGPSLDIQSACSSSLVATHLACQGLLSYQCDIALVGGISIQVPQKTGYYFQEGGITSPDGHCRAFDAKAQGTIFGSGVGLVVLKRLADALADRDTIHAVIKGSAINNDGSSKVGYTAPSIDGQAQVISLAQIFAGVTPETISYVEAHGTGTSLGDPVEVAALTKAFRTGTQAKRFCALGSVKTNVGHLDAAAGITGLIKTVLALKHKMLPPSLYFEEPNPRIDFDNSPFYVNASLKKWSATHTPRRAGISSVGIGGTNAHVIVEEAPSLPSSGESRPSQLLLLSAKTAKALEAASADLAAYLEAQKDVELADVAYTLKAGRKVFNYRRSVVCANAEDAARALNSGDPRAVFTLYQEPGDKPVVFMFPGGGAQYVNMGLDLYNEEPVFRDHLDECADLLTKYLGYDIRDRLYPDEDIDLMSQQMKTTSVGLPILFAVEYALAKLWMSWGVRPEAMIGHSLGEYVAACLSGIFSLEEALAVVHTRAELFEQLPRGSMISVPLGEAEVRELTKEGLSIAAINGPSQCVLSGPVEAIDEMARRLTERDVEFRRIQIDVAAHSHMVGAILDKFGRFVETLELNPPTIPFISNVTGTWITEAQAINPDYWVRHLRETVRFDDGLRELFEGPNRILLEVGPGQTLSTLAKLHSEVAKSRSIFSSMRHPYDNQSDDTVILATLGKLWASGASVEWESFYSAQSRQRIPLPTYPFERQRYWIDAPPSPTSTISPQARLARRADVGQWFYLPSWKRSLPLLRQPTAAGREASGNGVWLVLGGEAGVADQLEQRLSEQGEAVIRVRRGTAYCRESESRYVIEANRREDYERLLRAVEEKGERVERVVHLWSLSERAAGGDGEGKEEEMSAGGFASEQQRGFYSLLFLAQALSQHNGAEGIHFCVVTNQLLEVESRDSVHPEKATLLGPCKVIPQEYENISLTLVDIGVPEPGSEGNLVERLLAEAAGQSQDRVVAYRGNSRWVQSYEPVQLDGQSSGALRENGVYLITGGLGGIGLLLAEYLGKEARARLILAQRSRFPERRQWDDWLRSHDESDPTSRKVRKLQAIEESGAEVTIVSADVADERQMQSVVSAAFERYGKLDGIIYTAGIAGEKAIKLIHEVNADACNLQFQSKVHGLYVLEKILKERPVEFCLLFSSNASTLGGLGLATYAAANLFMDAFALNRDRRNGTRWVSANWDGWLLDDENRLAPALQTSIDQYAMTAGESLEAFKRVLSTLAASQVVVSTGDLNARLDLWITSRGRGAAADDANAVVALHPRPALGTAYVPPQSELEQRIVAIWQELLGVEQLGIHDNFFDLGGNSLICLKVVSRLQKDLGVSIPVVKVFEGPTVSALARVISQDPEEKPVYKDSRSRGERRREKRQQKARGV